MPVEHPAVDTIAPAFVATPVGIDVSHICQQYDRHQQNTSRREFHLHGPENQRVLILYAWCFFTVCKCNLSFSGSVFSTILIKIVFN